MSEAKYTNDIVKLSDIINNFGEVRKRIEDDDIKNDNKNEGPIAALKGTLNLLELLWTLNSPNWNVLKQKIRIGLIKETKEYGNTSVSMGAATVYFSKNKVEDVIFFNFGTGGIKFQYYTHKNGIIKIVCEYEPSKKRIDDNLSGIGPNSLK